MPIFGFTLQSGVVFVLGPDVIGDQGLWTCDYTLYTDAYLCALNFTHVIADVEDDIWFFIQVKVKWRLAPIENHHNR